MIHIHIQSGIILGGGLGILRTLYCLRDSVADLIPVDMVVNAVCAAAAAAAAKAQQALPTPPGVYHLTSGSLRPLLWGQVKTWAKEWLIRYPLENAVFYPGGHFRSNRLENRVARLLLHVLPAILVDSALYGAYALRLAPKPRLSLRKITLQVFRHRHRTYRQVHRRPRPQHKRQPQE